MTHLVLRCAVEQSPVDISGKLKMGSGDYVTEEHGFLSISFPLQADSEAKRFLSAQV